MPPPVLSAPPEGTESSALTVFDPDAPTGIGWWHWVVFNIPADTRELPQGAGDPEADLMPPKAVQSRTDFGTFDYGGPCPPEGREPHRYEFTLWALEVDHLPLDAEATGAMVGFFLNVNAIEST